MEEELRCEYDPIYTLLDHPHREMTMDTGESVMFVRRLLLGAWETVTARYAQDNKFLGDPYIRALDVIVHGRDPTRVLDKHVSLMQVIMIYILCVEETFAQYMCHLYGPDEERPPHWGGCKSRMFQWLKKMRQVLKETMNSARSAFNVVRITNEFLFCAKHYYLHPECTLETYPKSLETLIEKTAHDGHI
jgi:hypothetical protein